MKMYRIAFLFLLLFIYHSAISQTIEKNLKLTDFNSIDSSFATYEVSSVKYKVPTGKIWKIENIICGTPILVAINGKEILRTGFPPALPTYQYYNPNSVLWLKSQDEITFNAMGNVASNTIRFTYFEFILE
jgi:hypothetical protein